MVVEFNWICSHTMYLSMDHVKEEVLIVALNVDIPVYGGAVYDLLGAEVKHRSIEVMYLGKVGYSQVCDQFFIR